MGGRFRRFLGALLAGVTLFSAAAADQLCYFRIRPAVEEAVQEQADGTLLISSRVKKRKTAVLTVGTEGRSPKGGIWNLAELLRDRNGTVLHAFWDFEGMEAGKDRLRLVLAPKDGGMNGMSGRGCAGWNLWDVTPYLREILEKDQPMSFLLRTEKTGQAQWGYYDVRNGWIHVTVSLEDEEDEPEARSLTDSELLDIGLSALPADHWALRRYQEATGTLMEARWPETGVPYYYGGHSEDKVLHRFFPQQESRYYRSNRLYLCGFDCGSFLHWVEEKGEYELHEDLSELLKSRAADFPLKGLDSRDWYQALQPGDLLIFDHGTYHAGMYLGTPRIWGLSEAENPDLAGAMDAPLMLHCGEDPFCYDRFQAYIEAQDFRMTTSPPDGGVTVSLLVRDPSEAPRTRSAPWGKDYGYFEIAGQQVTAFSLNDCERMAWLRPIRK